MIHNDDLWNLLFESIRTLCQIRSKNLKFASTFASKSLLFLSISIEDEDLTIQESRNEHDDDSESNRPPWTMPKEQLQQWKRNLRALAYSTIGTLDYMAPEVLLKKGYGVVTSDREGQLCMRC